MGKILDTAAKKEEVKAQIKKILARTKEVLEEKLNKALASGAVPDEFFEQDNNLLARAIFDSMCKDRMFQAKHEEFKEDFENIHICI